MAEQPAETKRDDARDTGEAGMPSGRVLQDAEPRTEPHANTAGTNTAEVPAREVPVPQLTEKGPNDERDPIQAHGIEIDGTAGIRLDAASVILNDHFDIHPSRPLHNLDSPSARAFEAENRANQDINVLSLIHI